MLYTYTATISEENGIFYAKVPDISGCITIGSTLSETINLITDALNACLVVFEDEGVSPAPATDSKDILHEPNDILTVIQADTVLYRSQNDKLNLL